MAMQKSNKNIICDIDGTVLFDDHRRPLIPNGSAEIYFQACLGDEPNLPLITTLQMYRKMGYKIHFVTGRSESIREKTIQSFKMHGIPWDSLHMRRLDEYDPEGTTGAAFESDTLVKGRIVDEQGFTPLSTLTVFEDRPTMVEFWRSRGFACWQVRDEGKMY